MVMDWVKCCWLVFVWFLCLAIPSWLLRGVDAVETFSSVGKSWLCVDGAVRRSDRPSLQHGCYSTCRNEQ